MQSDHLMNSSIFVCNQLLDWKNENTEFVKGENCTCAPATKGTSRPEHRAKKSLAPLIVLLNYSHFF